MLGRCQEHRLNFWVQTPIHGGQLKLILKVRHSSQTPQDRLGILFSNTIYQQSIETDDTDIADVLQRKCRHIEPFFQAKQRLFGRTCRDGNNDFIEELAGPLGKINVPPGDRVKGARINRFRAHRGFGFLTALVGLRYYQSLRG